MNDPRPSRLQEGPWKPTEWTFGCGGALEKGKRDVTAAVVRCDLLWELAVLQIQYNMVIKLYQEDGATSLAILQCPHLPAPAGVIDVLGNSMLLL